MRDVTPRSGSDDDIHAAATRDFLDHANVSAEIHGGEIDDVVGLIGQYLEHRRRRDDEILAALRKAGGTAKSSDVVAVVYEGLGDDLKQAACETVLAHLDKLETEGRVCKRPDQDVDLWECK